MNTYAAIFYVQGNKTAKQVTTSEPLSDVDETPEIKSKCNQHESLLE